MRTAHFARGVNVSRLIAADAARLKQLQCLKVQKSELFSEFSAALAFMETKRRYLLSNCQ